MSLNHPRGDLEAPGASHPISVGQAVAVLAIAQSGIPFFEGQAIIKWPADQAHHYYVQFEGEQRVRERFVHPEYQANPEAYLAWMIEFWLASLAPSISDFFPEAVSP